MKKYEVTIYTRSNACLSPNKKLATGSLPANSIKNARIDAWEFFNHWFNNMKLHRNDVRIEVKPFTAE